MKTHNIYIKIKITFTFSRTYAHTYKKYTYIISTLINKYIHNTQMHSYIHK